MQHSASDVRVVFAVMGTFPSFRQTKFVDVSLRQTEHVEECCAQLGCELRDARARDASVGPNEQHGLGVPVEERLQRTGAVADDGDLVVVVPGPLQLRERSHRYERRAQGLPPGERDVTK
jgi:hypothetical protein